jgi:hypothetical protein
MAATETRKPSEIEAGIPHSTSVVWIAGLGTIAIVLVGGSALRWSR